MVKPVCFSHKVIEDPLFFVPSCFAFRSFLLCFVQDCNPLRLNVLNDNIFGESDEKGPIPGVQACGIGLETGFGLQVLIQNIEPDSYVKVYSWKQWVLNDIIFSESWNNGVKPWVFVLNQIPFVFPHKVIECSPDQIFPRLYWL